MPVLLGGILIVIGSMLVGLAYHDTYTQAYDVLMGHTSTPPATSTPSTPGPSSIQQTPQTVSPSRGAT